MNGDYEPVDSYGGTVRRRSSLRPLLIPGLAFLLGLGAMGYLLANWDSAARAIGIAPAAAPAPQPAPQQTLPAQPRAAPVQAQAEGAPEAIVIDPEIARRVAALEQRLGRSAPRREPRSAMPKGRGASGRFRRPAPARGVPLGFLGRCPPAFGATQRARSA